MKSYCTILYIPKISMVVKELASCGWRQLMKPKFNNIQPSLNFPSRLTTKTKTKPIKNWCSIIR